MKVTREDILRVAKKYLTQDARVILHYLPKETK
jgi:predicted Zn-dependent peptidase